MITEEQLDTYRREGTMLRVIRDADPANDVKGIIVAWDDSFVLVRRPNRRVVKLDRKYRYMPFSEPRPEIEWVPEAE
ncbi:hypothetical protein LJK88_33605 [Paenibacillus sp. P26]|nr:hypothetical protein LJK88_33605 [Paenibacillus sp. P26]UUZ93939.1 hypothetical protein LJK87_04510 [Paenibacillus sp. P25]